MPRKKVPKPPLFSPYTIHDEEGNEYLADEPLIPPPKHHKTEKANRLNLAIWKDITKNSDKWDLRSGYKFNASAVAAGFRRANVETDDRAHRRRFKAVKGLLSLFRVSKDIKF
ncbi:MAG: hypothetical protein NTX38_15095 [Methylobacter sp.]|nr:hypothetical protein [Methylobacter sp.]